MSRIEKERVDALRIALTLPDIHDSDDVVATWGELRSLLQEVVDGAMSKVGCPSCGDSCEHEWVLISPENLRFTGKSAFDAMRNEISSRIPPSKQLENIIKANEAAELDYQVDVARAAAKAVEPYRKERDEAWAAFKGIRKLLGEAKYGDRLKNEIKLLDTAIAAAEGK